MILNYNVKSEIKLNIFENYECGAHYKYDSNANVFWDILSAEILADTVKLKVVRSQEDERATETYIDADDYDKYSYYALKFDMTFWITISKTAIDESLKRHDSVKTKIDYKNPVGFNRQGSFFIHIIITLQNSLTIENKALFQEMDFLSKTTKHSPQKEPTHTLSITSSFSHHLYLLSQYHLQINYQSIFHLHQYLL